MLGLYDSGLGGLTVLRALRAAGIDQDVVYFADQAHVPYGDRTDADLYGLLEANFAVLERFALAAIVMACNTSCAVAASAGGFPRTTMPVLDLIGQAAAALHDMPALRIAVLATAATVRSGAYRRAIDARAPQHRVLEIAAPALVPLVEGGLAATAAAHAAVADVCARLPADIDAVVYGCTHYPILDLHFASILDPRIRRIDPATAQAAATVTLIGSLALAAAGSSTHYVTNGDDALFEANVRRAMGDAPATFGRVPAVPEQLVR